MEFNIETMSLSDLKEIKSILTERLEKKEKWMIAERGHNSKKVCSKHLEPYVRKCPRCQEHFDQSVYEHMSNNNMFY